jgi:predicted PurR-regulated permease PerM
MTEGGNRIQDDFNSGNASLRTFALKVLVSGLILAGLIFFLLILWYMANFLLLAFAGLLMTLIIRAFSNPLKRILKLADWACVLLVILAAAGGLYIMFSTLAPSVAAQAGELRQRLPDALQNLAQKIGSHPLGQTLLQELPRLQEWISKRSVLQEITRFFSATFGVVANGLILVFIGLYFSFNPGVYVTGFLRLVPPGRRERAAEVLDSVGTMLRRWLIGRLIGMTVIGVLIGAGLWFLNIPLALTLGLLTTLLDFIPFIGPFVAALPAVLLGFLDSPGKALTVIGLFVFVQQIENYIIIPVIERNRVFLPPAVIIFAQVLLGFSAGLLGLALATPITAVIMVLVQMLYVEDVLGEKAELAGK